MSIFHIVKYFITKPVFCRIDLFLSYNAFKKSITAMKLIVSKSLTKPGTIQPKHLRINISNHEF
jgi:hypothetical protein